jgi:hypothetical protein
LRIDGEVGRSKGGNGYRGLRRKRRRHANELLSAEYRR